MAQRKKAIFAGLFFLAGSFVYGLLVLVFAVAFDGREISRDAPIIYPVELLPLVPLLLLALFVYIRE